MEEGPKKLEKQVRGVKINLKFNYVRYLYWMKSAMGSLYRKKKKLHLGYKIPIMGHILSDW